MLAKTVTILLISLFCILGLGQLVLPRFVRSGRSKASLCINNLRQIDGGKQQWALENHKGSNDIPTSAEVAMYLKNNRFPVCPAGGKYTIGPVYADPTCSKPNHVLPTP